MPFYFRNGKPFFSEGGLPAWSPACCCNLPCSRMVIVVAIAAGQPFYTTPGNPPLRGGEGGHSYLMYAANSFDTFSSGAAGQNYRNKVWTIEFCFNQFDVLPGDQKPPDESYLNHLVEWSCAAQAEWTGSTFCTTTVQAIDDPYDIDTYYGTGGIDDTYLNMDGVVGPGNWYKQELLAPVLCSNCKNCTCMFSCVPDGSCD